MWISALSVTVYIFSSLINPLCCQYATKATTEVKPIKLDLIRLLNIDDVLLVVSVDTENKINEQLFTNFEPAKLRCDLVPKALAYTVERKIIVPLNEIGRDATLLSITFELDILEEGTIQCSYSTETNILSNSLILAFRNIHYYAVGLLSERRLDANELSTSIGAKDIFTIVESGYGESTFFRFSANLQVKSSEADSAVLRQIQSMFASKSQEDLSMGVNFTRSTRFCQPIRSLNITHTRIGFFAKNGAKCEGNNIIGAYWSDPNLQRIIRNEINGSMVFNQLVETKLTTIVGIQNFSVGLSQVGAVNTREMEVLAEKFDQLVADEGRVLRDTDLKKKLNTSNTLLTSLDSVLANVPLPSGPAQLDLTSFAVRVENARLSKNDGIYSNDPRSQMVSINFDRSNEYVIENKPK